MDPRYGRPPSPGSRRLVNPMRSSTGSVPYSSAYDDYYIPPRGSRDYGPSPRSSGDRIAAPRMLTRINNEDHLSSAKLRDDYVTRPRRSTLEVDPMAMRQPLSVIPTSSPNRARPVVTSALERASGHHAKPSRSGADEDYYLVPASSGSRHDHRRISSANNTAELGRLTTGDKELRDRMDREGYRGSTSNSARQGYHLNGPLVRHQDTDAYDGYSYTDPREQMYRDTAPRPRPRRDSLPGGRRERPLSMTGLDDYLPRLGPATREPGPPPSRRGFDKIGRNDSLRQGSRALAEDQRARDYVPPRNEDPYNVPKRRTSTRNPVSLHQRIPDDGYESYQDAYDDPYERHRQTSRYDDHPDRRDYGGRADSRAHRFWDDDDYDRDGVRNKSRRSHEDRRKDYKEKERYDRDECDDGDKGSRKKSDREGELLAAGAAAALSGGLAGTESRDRDRHRHEGREKDPREPNLNGETQDRDRHKKKSTDYGGQDGDTSGEERRERRRERRREKEALRREREGRDPRDEAIRERSPVRPEDIDKDSEEEEQRHRTHRHRQDQSRERVSLDGSQGDKAVDMDAERPRSAGVVSAIKEKEPEIPVKGILRPPREKFPEDPAPVREGVAPLKDAGKKGIPVNARWTKIDRKLVNPEALEEGHERYEERLDYVIVLRVLTKEEIQAYAAKTQEIRDARYLRELQEEQRHRLGQAELGGEADRVARTIEDRPRDPLRASVPSDERIPTTDSESSKRAPDQESVNGGRLREDPSNPGTYTGYSRNPPAPAPRQPKQYYMSGGLNN